MRSKKAFGSDNLTDRIRQVRLATFGPRGRAKFSRALGVSPSTYNYYERGRVPPIPTLLRISQVAGVDLRWLLTGQSPSGQPGTALSPQHAKILTRMSAMLPQRAEAAAALNVLIDLLESQPQPTTPSAAGPARKSVPISHPLSRTRIPVMGRTAAGVPHFWRTPKRSVDLLKSVIGRGAASSEPRSATLADPDDRAPVDMDEQVHLVQLAQPVRLGELCVAEFVDVPNRQDNWPDDVYVAAFALRIDGESMHPSLSHGDLVIVSPHQAALAGRPAVVQLRNQIGVTCKLFYKDKQHLHLIPINEQFRSTKHALKDLVSALAVLYRVRLSR